MSGVAGDAHNRPVLCMVTDRRRIGAGDTNALVHQVTAAANAGVHLVQLRERDLDGGALFDLTRQCLQAVRGTRTRVVVNERLDVAVAAGAHGVHLRGDSFTAARARTLTPAGFLVGRSVHSMEEVRQVSAESGVDYLVFGNVYVTESKPSMPAAGLEAMREVAAATSIPVLAIGGLTAARIEQVLAAGASGIAAIGLFAADLSWIGRLRGPFPRGLRGKRAG